MESNIGKCHVKSTRHTYGKPTGNASIKSTAGYTKEKNAKKKQHYAMILRLNLEEFGEQWCWLLEQVGE